MDLLRGDSALLDAAKKGNLGRVQKLLSKENINCRDSQVLIVHFWIFKNRTSPFKKCNQLNTNMYSYLETSVGQISNLYLNVVHSLDSCGSLRQLFSYIGV